MSIQPKYDRLEGFLPAEISGCDSIFYEIEV
jgi:hypothetical protein